MFENTPDDATNQTPEAYLEALVGEGKMYKTVADLAKGKAHADAKIAADAAELARLKEAETELTVTKRLLEAANKSVPPVVESTESKTPAAVTPLTDEELESRIETKLTARAESDRKSRNQDVAAARMVEVFGDVNKAKAAIAARATELGVSREWLEGTAGTSPAAFFSAMGVKEKDAPSVSTPAPKGEVNPAVLAAAAKMQSSKPGTYNFYKALRQADSKTYHSASTQKQMHEDAMRLGADFYL